MKNNNPFLEIFEAIMAVGSKVDVIKERLDKEGSQPAKKLYTTDKIFF